MIPESHSRALFAELLEPVATLLADRRVSEILINGPDRVFAERAGRLAPVDVRFGSAQQLESIVRAVAQYVGRPCDLEHPVLEGRLPDGSRVTALLPPVAREGVHIAIRRFSEERLSAQALVELGTLSSAGLSFLEAALLARKNIVVAGGTGTGKTSLLAALAEQLPAHERVVVIEDASELHVRHAHVVQLEARPADRRGRGAITIRELLRATLRLRPDRIILGEVRDGAALDLVQALSSGHGGSLATLHASHVCDVLHRLETMALMADVELPLAALRAQIASAVDVIVLVERSRGGQRQVSHISEVRGQGSAARIRVHDVFVREHNGVLAFQGASAELCTALESQGWTRPSAAGRSS